MIYFSIPLLRNSTLKLIFLSLLWIFRLVLSPKTMSYAPNHENAKNSREWVKIASVVRFCCDFISIITYYINSVYYLVYFLFCWEACSLVVFRAAVLNMPFWFPLMISIRQMYQSFRPVLCFVKTLEPTRVLKLEIGAFLTSIREREGGKERVLKIMRSPFINTYKHYNRSIVS